jgi:hypothetical protein
VTLPAQPFTFDEMLRECDRELRMRKQVYPNRILTGRLKEREASRQMALMQAIRAVLNELAKTERLL